MTIAAITFAVNILSSAFKNYIFPRFGKVGVQAVVFFMALIGAVYYTYLQHIASVQMVVAYTVAIFSLAVAFYEVLLSYFPFFKPSDSTTPPAA